MGLLEIPDFGIRNCPCCAGDCYPSLPSAGNPNIECEDCGMIFTNSSSITLEKFIEQFNNRYSDSLILKGEKCVLRLPNERLPVVKVRIIEHRPSRFRVQTQHFGFLWLTTQHEYGPEEYATIEGARAEKERIIQLAGHKSRIVE